MIVDGHLDLAPVALHFRRDLTLTAEDVRKTDPEDLRKAYGSCTVTFPELRRGTVGLVFSSILSRLDASGSYAGTGMRTQQQCYAIGRGHAAYYQIMEQAGEIRLVRSRRDLNDTVGAWGAPGEKEPVGVVMTMESADPIVDPDQVQHWYDLGLRIVSLTHIGKGVYAHGTGVSGGLLPGARPLLEALAAAGVALDVTHLTDKAFEEAMKLWEGPVLASHHNCRELVPGQRQLTDEMIRLLIERDAVIGACFALYMLDPKLNTTSPERNVGLEAVVDHIDHICNIAGNSRHAALGTDLDGGFGLEMSPSGMDTIADLPRLAEILTGRGYTEQDVANILSDNWIGFLSRILAD